MVNSQLIIKGEIMHLTVEQIERIGQALYGDQWIANLARSLNINPRRIPEWQSGKRPIPQGVKPELLELLKNNESEIQNLIQELK